MSELLPYPPEDFDQFWQETVAESDSAPLDFTRSRRNEFDLAGFTVETFRFRGVNGEALHGWFAIPEGVAKAPAFLWVPPYGRESLLPNQYGTRKGFASLSFNFFGHESFHQEKYLPARGYFAEGVEEPQTWIFRRMLQNANVALRVLEAQGEVDETRLASTGMSQGAGISIWLGAWCRRLKAICADMPFLSSINTTLEKHIYRYPLKELVDHMEKIPFGRERVFHTVSYFDTLNQATRCNLPTLVSYGVKDPAVRPETAKAVYAALPGQKRLIEYAGGHDWHEEMVENNREWLNRALRIEGLKD